MQFLVVVLIVVTLMTNDIEHLVMYLLTIVYVVFGEIAVYIFFPSLNWIIFVLSSKCSLEILDSSPLPDT